MEPLGRIDTTSMTVDELLQNLTKEEKETLYKSYLNKANVAAPYYRTTPTTGWVCEIVRQNTGCSSIYDVKTEAELIRCCDAVKNSGKDSGSQYSSPINKYIEAVKDAIKNHYGFYINFVIKRNLNNTAFQTIFYGSPGSGKSFTVKQILALVNNANFFRTTFHPDCDYYSFVGAYKPRKDNKGSITYDFSPQVFTKAYIKAWENMLNPLNNENGVQTPEPCVLVIEEINRGNCAQIFGDLFQLLDRDGDGYSEYPIKADEDLMSYVKTNCKNPAAYSNDELRLPPNLYIVATMNTSDQSLFPMDSAFKRRWAWKYVPIDYTNAVSGGFKITIGGTDYVWHDFLEKINAKIYKVTNSEDKMLGNFFIKSSIDEEDFVDKVMFYLWNDVLKLEYASGNDYFFKKEDDSKFKFSDLYDSNTRTSTLESFMKYLGL